jgi:hypothetical protein
MKVFSIKETIWVEKQFKLLQQSVDSQSGNNPHPTSSPQNVL